MTSRDVNSTKTEEIWLDHFGANLVATHSKRGLVLFDRVSCSIVSSIAPKLKDYYWIVVNNEP
jgi:hypothetical protein